MSDGEDLGSPSGFYTLLVPWADGTVGLACVESSNGGWMPMMGDRDSTLLAGRIAGGIGQLEDFDPEECMSELPKGAILRAVEWRHPYPDLELAEVEAKAHGQGIVKFRLLSFDSTVQASAGWLRRPRAWKPGGYKWDSWYVVGAGGVACELKNGKSSLHSFHTYDRAAAFIDSMPGGSLIGSRYYDDSPQPVQAQAFDHHRIPIMAPDAPLLRWKWGGSMHQLVELVPDTY